MADRSNPLEASAWNLPAEWAVDPAFWRDVATRTLAGILTLIVLGVPVLIWAMVNNKLTADQGVPILIGIGLFVILLITYLAALAIVRARRRHRLSSVVESDPEAAKYSATEMLLLVSSLLADQVPGGDVAESVLKLRNRLSEKSKEQIAHINRISRIVNIAAMASGLVAAVVTVVVTFNLAP